MTASDGLPYELPDYVSPSSLATYTQCPLKYKYSRVNKLSEPPTQATLLGNFVHDVLESFYGLLAPDERTYASLRSLSTSTWADGDWATRLMGIVPEKESQNFRWSAWWCLENIFKVENPNSITVSGVETELDAKIGDARVKGFIDRWFVDNGSIKISDYKTGKTPRHPYVEDKFLQLLIYASLLSQTAPEPISTVELIYLKDGKKFVKSVGPEAMSSVFDAVTKTYDSIVKSFNDNDWPARPTKLCYWCYFKDTVCEYWRKENNERS